MDEDNFLIKYGLSIDTLKMLSYRSKLGISLKRNIHYFDKTSLLQELFDYSIGVYLRSKYEEGFIRNENEFKVVFDNALSGNEKT